MAHKGTPLRRMATSMELPPPSPSQAPIFSQPTLDIDDFVRWGKDSRSSSSGGLFVSSSGYSSIHVSRTSSSDSSLFPEDSSSGPEDSHSTVKPARRHSRRLRSRLSDSTAQSGQSPAPLLSGDGKPGGPSQPNLAKMLKGVSEVLEENTRLKKKRLEREVRKSRLKSRTPAKPYDVAPAERVSSASGGVPRRVSGASAKETVKVMDQEAMSVDPAPKRSRQNTVSKGKGRGVDKGFTDDNTIEDIMDVDSSVTLGDFSMSEDLLPKDVDNTSKPAPSDSQSSAKMMPPPPVPSKVFKQSPNPKPPSKPPPSKPPPSKPPPSKPTDLDRPPPPTPPSSTQSNPPRRRTLGMTRTTTQTNVVSHSVLPANRKPFKSPLIKQEPGSSQSGGPSRSQTRAYPIPTSSSFSQPICPSQKPIPAKSTPKVKKPKKKDPAEIIDIADDLDSSYDFSNSSIDGEEFNKAMEEYDRGVW